MKYIIAIAMLVMLVVPLHGAQANLVVCGQSVNDDSTPNIDEHRECTPCLLLEELHTIINFVTFELTPIFAFVLIVVAGLMIILGGANSELVGSGKKMLTNTLIGVLIIYGAYMVTNFVIRNLAGANNVATNWFDLSCSEEEGGAPVGPGPGGTSGEDDGGGVGGIFWTPLPVTAGTVSDADARAALHGACETGTTNCIDPNGLRTCSPSLGNAQPSCGYYQGVRQSSVDKMVAFKKNECPTCHVTINDATGPGHSNGSTHYVGDAFDVQHDSGLDAHINSLPQDPGHIGDSRYHIDAQGMTWFNEDSQHWHVTAH